MLTHGLFLRPVIDRTSVSFYSFSHNKGIVFCYIQQTAERFVSGAINGDDPQNDL